MKRSAAPVEGDRQIVVIPGVAGRDERNIRCSQGEVAIDISLVAVCMDDVGVRMSSKLSNARGYGAVDLSGAGDQMGLDSLGGRGRVKLQIRICGV